jgi:hypothetical protein
MGRAEDDSRADEFDRMIDEWIASCECEVCERYRKSFAIRAGAYAAQIEQQLKRRTS